MSKNKDEYKVTDYHDFCTIDTSVEKRKKLNIGDIWDNSIRCKLCGDVIRSKNRHHMAWCKCKSCAVDGGSWYTKVVCDYDGLDNIEIMTIMFNDVDDVEK